MGMAERGLIVVVFGAADAIIVFLVRYTSHHLIFIKK